MTRRTLASILVGALLLLAACAPAQGERAGEATATIAMLNAPAQSAVPGSADAVQAELEGRADAPFGFVSAFSMRFLETHNDLFHSRAAPSAARIARTQNADLAVMVGAPVLEREVTEGRGASRRVDVTLALEAQVVDPRNDAVVQVLRTRTLQGSRVESVDLPLPDVTADPTVLALRDRAAPELAASLLAELPYLISSLLIGSNGG
ncbi:MAG: hypothetical protein GX560_09670 [Deinococcales bacterium]|nr:hypothetical protein [Deinococcales bacterium]